MLLGLSATNVRYFLKVVHRILLESQRIYSPSMWLQVCGLTYLNYIFLSYWSFGLISSCWFIKSMLFLINFVVIAISKVSMI